MQFRSSDLFVSRVLAEDADFATLEVGKRDDVTYNLHQNAEGEVVGGDRFLTILFVKTDGQGGAEIWDPFND